MNQCPNSTEKVQDRKIINKTLAKIIQKAIKSQPKESQKLIKQDSISKNIQKQIKQDSISKNQLSQQQSEGFSSRITQKTKIIKKQKDKHINYCNIRDKFLQKQFKPHLYETDEVTKELKYVKQQIQQALAKNGHVVTINGVLKELRSKGINRSVTSIGRYISKMGYTRKRIDLRPKDTPEIQNQLKIFAAKIKQAPIQQIIFVDELGYYQFRSTDCGWCKSHQKSPYFPIEKSLLRDITIVASISIQKILSFKIVKGNCTKQIFEQFIKDTVSKLQSRHQYILYDETHLNYPDVLKSVVGDKLKCQIVPKHKIDLNPLFKLMRMIDNETRRKLDFYKMELNEMEQFIMEYVKGIDFRIIEELYDRYREVVQKNVS